MATYTTYLTDEMCAEALADGRDGKPIDAVGHRGRLMPRAGDTVVLITSRRRQVYALASLQVEKVVEEIERLADFCPDYGDAVISSTIIRGKPLAPLRFDRALTELQAQQWVYDSPSGPRPLTADPYDRRGSIRSFAKVTPETAAMLDRVLGLAPATSSLSGAEALEVKLRESPQDEQLAQVLADAWQAEGDPRGELLSLELALRRETDLARVAEIDLRLSTLAKKTRGVRNRPGGFPFRSVWGSREVLELDARLELEARTVDDALAAASTWLEVEGVSKLTFRLSRLPRQLEEQLEDLGGSQSWLDRPQGRAWEWRRRLMPLEALRPWLLEYPLEVTFAGRPRMPGTSCCAPLLTSAVWRGPRPLSKAMMSFETRVARMIRLRLRLPVGTAFGAALEQSLNERTGPRGLGPRRQTVTWSADAERGLEADRLPRFSDERQRRITDPLYVPRNHVIDPIYTPRR